MIPIHTLAEELGNSYGVFINALRMEFQEINLTITGGLECFVIHRFASMQPIDFPSKRVVAMPSYGQRHTARYDDCAVRCEDGTHFAQVRLLFYIRLTADIEFHFAFVQWYHWVREGMWLGFLHTADKQHCSTDTPRSTVFDQYHIVKSDDYTLINSETIRRRVLLLPDFQAFGQQYYVYKSTFTTSL